VPGALVEPRKGAAGREAAHPPPAVGLAPREAGLAARAAGLAAREAGLAAREAGLAAREAVLLPAVGRPAPPKSPEPLPGPVPREAAAPCGLPVGC
jgi:hypothetical protein